MLMKKIILLTGILFSLFADYSAQAQVTINLGKPVAREPWYATDNNYYYLPEQGVYYNVSRRAYIFPDGGNWLYANRLPSRYGNYTYRTSQYVRVNERSPFMRDDYYKQKYYKGNNPKAQGRHDNGNRNGAARQVSGGRVQVKEVNRTQVQKTHRNAAHSNNGQGNRGNQGKGKK
jgi:hypothetical protein